MLSAIKLNMSEKAKKCLRGMFGQLAEAISLGLTNIFIFDRSFTKQDDGHFHGEDSYLTTSGP